MGVRALREADSYQPIVGERMAVENWPVLKTTGELAAFKNAHHRPVGPVYFKRPGWQCVELVSWYPGDFRVLGREWPSGKVDWIHRTAGTYVSASVGHGEE